MVLNIVNRIPIGVNIKSWDPEGQTGWVCGAGVVDVITKLPHVVCRVLPYVAVLRAGADAEEFSVRF